MLTKNFNLTPRINNLGVVVGIDATRNRSGGAVSHMIGLLSAGNPISYGVLQVHLWAYDELLDAIEEQAWLVKHRVLATHGSIIKQILWQYFRLPVLARGMGLDVIFNTDAGSLCPYRPCVTLSQDMLSFEPGEMQRYRWLSKERMRLELLRFIQLRSLKRSEIALFLSEHAARVIGKLATLSKISVVPHGINPVFFQASALRRPWPENGPIHCLYVSNVAPYKHQWHVVNAIAQLRNATGFDLRIRFVGGGIGSAMAELRKALSVHDPHFSFVQLERYIPNKAIVDELAHADLFVYASSCENLPITLLEAMAAGLPIASSNRGPMPEVLGDAAAFFDPEKPTDIAKALMSIIANVNFRKRIAADALIRAKRYTWQRCAGLTWQALVDSVSVP